MASSKAREILALIYARHTKDVFVPECKDGATQFGPHFRLDAWAMKRSWVRPLTTGYEIKISRSDFVRDAKLFTYLDLCNQLYLVCSPGVCDPSEVPEQCGLMIPSSTGSRLFIKRKAPYREIEEPAMLYKYVLMARATVTGGRYYIDHGDRSRFWRKWLETKEYNQDLGHCVSKALRQVMDKKILEMELKQASLDSEINRLKRVEEILVTLGLDQASSWMLERDLKRRIAERRTGIAAALGRDLDAARSSAAHLVSSIEQLRVELGVS